MILGIGFGCAGGGGRVFEKRRTGADRDVELEQDTQKKDEVVRGAHGYCWSSLDGVASELRAAREVEVIKLSLSSQQSSSSNLIKP